MPLLICVVVFLGESLSIQPQLDDAYISYRYARNLVEGQGLVYNPGEYVGGFTNLLWTLLVAAGLSLGVDAKAVGHTLGVASGVALLVATQGYARALLVGGWRPAACHLWSNADYILSREPDYILIRSEAEKREVLRAPTSSNELVLPRLNAELDLYAHPDFRRLYVWDELALGYYRR